MQAMLVLACLMLAGSATASMRSLRQTSSCVKEQNECTAGGAPCCPPSSGLGRSSKKLTCQALLNGENVSLCLQQTVPFGQFANLPVTLANQQAKPTAALVVLHGLGMTATTMLALLKSTTSSFAGGGHILLVFLNGPAFTFVNLSIATTTQVGEGREGPGSRPRSTGNPPARGGAR